MKTFQHILWGFEFSYPDEWLHRTIKDTEGFAAIEQAFDSDYCGPRSGHLLVRAEWNSARNPIEPVWNQHIALTAGFLGAKKLGSAPWKMGGAIGFEAEISLPKQKNLRLWTGILEHGFTVIHLMVAHPKQERQWFEPTATEIIKTLRFPTHVDGIPTNEAGIPLLPDLEQVDPVSVVPDIQDFQNWQAYEGRYPVGGLQAFFLRELPAHGWKICEYVPFPGPVEPGFARFIISRDNQNATLGILPFDEKILTAISTGKIVVHYDSSIAK